MLKAGIDVDVQDSRGCPTNRTALMHAADNGHLGVVDFLLKSGARVNAIDKGFPVDCPGGNTALILAIQKGHLEVAHRLLDAGASPKTKGGGTSVLNAAAYQGNELLVKKIIELGADTNQRDGSGHMPIASAILNEKIGIVELLLKVGVDSNSKSAGGSAILIGAVAGGNLELCRLLIKHGAAPDTGNADNFTPLMMACSVAQTEIVKFLLSQAVVVNRQDIRGRTALDIVRHLQRPSDLSPEVLQRRIEMGIPIGYPPENLTRIASLLIKAGAKTSEELKARK